MERQEYGICCKGLSETLAHGIMQYLARSVFPHKSNNRAVKSTISGGQSSNVAEECVSSGLTGVMRLSLLHRPRPIRPGPPPPSRPVHKPHRSENQGWPWPCMISIHLPHPPTIVSVGLAMTTEKKSRHRHPADTGKSIAIATMSRCTPSTRIQLSSTLTTNSGVRACSRASLNGEHLVAVELVSFSFIRALAFRALSLH